MMVPLETETISRTPVIAVIDDEEMVTKSIESFLMLETDYQVLTFQSPVAALKCLKKTPPDVVIADFLMPEMNGLEFLNELKNQYPDVPGVLLTAYADKENAIKGINEVGLFQYVQKPWDNDNLKMIIQNGLANKSLKTTLKEKIKEIDNVLRQRDELFKLHNILNEEMAFAKRIHNKLLPPNYFNINDIIIDTTYKPALEIGGDFYDVIPLKDNKIALLVADITGHGIQAALCTALLKFSFSEFYNKDTTGEQILKGMNQVLFKGLPDNIFAAALVVIIDTATRECTMHNAGIPHPFLIQRQKQNVEKIVLNGLVLGFVKETIYDPGPSITIQLQKDDMLLIFSDGLSEIRDKDNHFFGDHRLNDVLENNISLDNKKLCELIQKEASQFNNHNKMDDLMIVNVSGN